MTPKKTREYFMKISKLVYLIGSEDYWCEDLNISPPVKTFHFFFKHFVTVASTLLIILQWGVFFTNQKLTVKQNLNSKIFALAHPVSFATLLMTENNKKKVGALLRRLVLNLKEIYNDEDVEKSMIEQSTFILKGYSIIMSMTGFLYGVEGYIQVQKGYTFVTIVTAWPDVEDFSAVASAAKVAIYIVWILLLLRLTSVFIIAIPLTVCLSHQFINLRSYFEKLNDIFKEDTSQEEKEKKFEQGFKVGIKLHSETLECVHQLQELFDAVYGGQIIIKSTALMALMLSMANAERTLAHVLTTLMTASYSLISLGCLVWNAGDTTVEASSLSSTIYSSGWQNCTKKTTGRIKALVVVALLMSQRPVELKCLGNLTLSYGSYVTIVKSSYSGFSVLY